MVIRLYTLFLALLISLFVGVGIAAFYSEPKPPEYPAELQKPIIEQSQAQIRANDDFQKRSKQHQAAQKTYDHNVSLIAMAAAILLVALGLIILKNIAVITDSLLLGGVFTLSYSIIRGFGSGDDVFRFLLVSVGLAVAVLLGYLKFIRPLEASKHK